MRVRGDVLGFFFIFFVIMNSIVGGAPPHRWYDTAILDTTAITGLVEQELSESNHALEVAVSINCTVDFNASLTLHYNANAYASAVDAKNALANVVFYSADKIMHLKDVAASYDFLHEQLVPLEVLVSNISFFMHEHEHIIFGFQQMINCSYAQENRSSVQQVLSELRMAHIKAERHLEDAQVGVERFSSLDIGVGIQGYIMQLFSVLDRYEGYIRQFAEYFPVETPRITLYVDKTKLYLGDQGTLFGYCMADNHFLQNQRVTVYKNMSQYAQVFTDDQGRFDCVFPDDTQPVAGKYLFFASMRVDSIYYDSSTVELLISRIPTSVTLDVSPKHVYLNESIQLEGQVVDYQGYGVQTRTFIHINETFLEVNTNRSGMFSIEHPVSFFFGQYGVSAEVPASSKYLGSNSEKKYFFVDIPTALKIHAPDINIQVGDDIVIVGNLRSDIDGTPVVNASIDLVLGTKVVNSTFTDDFGVFQCRYPSASLGAGSYQVNARFQGLGAKWRGSHSSSIPITLYFPLTMYIPIIGVLIGLAVFLIMIWMFRQQISTIFGKPVKHAGQHADTPKGLPRLRFARRIGHSLRRIHRGARLTQDAVQDAVFAQYRLLLRFLATKGIIITPTDTHLDVQQRMNQQGLPTDAVDLVTQTFEQAMYAPQPVTYEQLLQFDKHIFQLMTDMEA